MQVRIGTADREEVLALLSEHLSLEKIGPDEFSQRSSEVSAARTQAELRAVIADLSERIGKVERDRAQAMLSDHLASGRLTDELFFERSAMISAARTGLDLTPIFADLVDYSDDDRVRISSAERDLAQAQLEKHFSEDRLTVDEFSARSAAVNTVVTRAELKRLFADLPPTPPRPGRPVVHATQAPSTQGRRGLWPLLRSLFEWRTG